MMVAIIDINGHSMGVDDTITYKTNNLCIINNNTNNDTNNK